MNLKTGTVLLPPTESSPPPPGRPVEEQASLAALGIHGLEALTVPVLAALAGREPLLLVGTHGTAKTLLCRRLAEALGLRFRAYDATKALFEDILGFPDPQSLTEGRIRYVPTPLSIWDVEFLLIDELSRADAGMQNKWLELIRSRQIMGEAVTGLQQVVSAMNPPDYPGAVPLDPALAGRFATILRVPEAEHMADDDLRAIIRNRTAEDAFGVDEYFDGANWPARIAAVRARIADFPEAAAGQLERYTIAVQRQLAEQALALDGRRLGMLWRGLRADLATAVELGQLDEPGDAPFELDVLDAWLAELLPVHLPFATSDEPVPDSVIEAAHASALDQLQTRRPRPRRLAGSNLSRTRQLLEHETALEPLQRRAEVSRMLADLRLPAEARVRAEQARALELLAHAVCTGTPFEIDEQARILERFDAALADRNEHALADLLRGIAENFPEIDLYDVENMRALRRVWTLDEHFSDTNMHPGLREAVRAWLRLAETQRPRTNAAEAEGRE